eukprot:CAMPEP_0172454832 /NCGR_PEP_ID=MMETSP1065-20121228/11709_1 /TAXON_ID=265537 /ORGANISM="Amphiprora paludosa, Strain CCMP125" /LENGTH=353 /DNA_ID=CAMNT_0013207229 /DNA_START=129 /DNA_END=1190 /DNA_ORIENTATION=+
MNMNNTNTIDGNGSSSSTGTLLETLAAMRHQEERGYLPIDYLHHQPAQHEHQSPAPISPRGPLDHRLQPLPQPQDPILIDAKCRGKMVEWCYRVVDYCHFSRESVELAIRLLDRFLATPAAHTTQVTTCSRAYQLAVMASLYTAVKIHEPQAMTPELLSSISKGVYEPAEIEEMEMTLLLALRFRVNPPTAHAFCRTSLELLASAAPALVSTTNDTNDDDDLFENVTSVWDTIQALAQVQIEGAVLDYDLSMAKASALAYHALINALDVVDMTGYNVEAITHLLQRALLDIDHHHHGAVPHTLKRILMQQTAAAGWGAPLSRRRRSTSTENNRKVQTTRGGPSSPRSAAVTTV